MASKLYVFGDSFSTPYVEVNPEDSFWGLAAKELPVDQVINYSWPRNCLDNLIHSILNEPIDFENNYFLIGMPVLFRDSIYCQGPGRSEEHTSELQSH
mgnify:CR=1 FL=1